MKRREVGWDVEVTGKSELETEVRRGLIVLAVLVVAVPSILYVAPGLVLACAIRGADPFPAFMADYHPKGSWTYAEAERAFPDFHCQDVSSRLRQKRCDCAGHQRGFEITGSNSEAVKLRWNRHAGPCSEQYSIVIDGDADGRIAGIVGELHPICL
jgi:hypothetical protein